MKKVVDAIVSIAFLFLIAISFLKRSIAMPNTDIVDEIKFDLVADQVKETAPQINGVKGNIINCTLLIFSTNGYYRG